MTPSVAVLMLTWNQREDTVKCLESIARGGYPDYRVYVVDNGSEDGTFEEINNRFDFATVIKHSTNLGAAAGRNSGLRKIRQDGGADIVFFLDNDTEIDQHAINRLRSFIVEHPGISLVLPKTLQLAHPELIDEAGGCEVNFWTGLVKQNGHGVDDGVAFGSRCFNPGLGSSAALAVRWEVIDHIGGFDVRYDPYGYEDLDFNLRARAAGFLAAYEPAVVIYHKGNKTGFGGYTYDYAFLKGRNLKIFLKKHASLVQRTVCASFMFIRILGIMIRERHRIGLNPALGMFKGFFLCKITGFSDEKDLSEGKRISRYFQMPRMPYGDQ